MESVISVENISKQYRLGQIGTGTISHDLNRWWHKVRGKEDPYLKVGEVNNRTVKGESQYVWALKDINFDLGKGERLGIIGRNGAGKSTLLKILSRTTAPTQGKIKIKGRVASLLEVGTGFHPELSGRENIFLNGAILGMSKKEIQRKFDEIVHFAGVERYIDTPVKRFSSGMYVRLAFGVAAHLESEILVVDEVLAVGDAEFQKKCLEKMEDVSKGEGRTVLFVSHNIQAIKKLCNKGVFLSDGMVSYKGNIKDTVENYYKIYNNINDTGGLIPEHLSSFNTGIARFVKSIVRIEDGAIFYQEPINLELEIECLQELTEVFIDIRVCSTDFFEISHSSNVYSEETITGLSLKKGKNKISVTIQNDFQPGNYNLTLGLHKLDGADLDLVENINQFEILTIAKNGKDFLFPGHWELGKIRVKSKWEIHE